MAVLKVSNCWRLIFQSQVVSMVLPGGRGFDGIWTPFSFILRLEATGGLIRRPAASTGWPFILSDPDVTPDRLFILFPSEKIGIVNLLMGCLGNF